MKTIKKSIEWAAKILSFLILLQSCTVYHNYSSSVDEAIATNDKVKLDINNDDPYKFKKIKIFGTECYGLTKIKSDTYRRLSDRKKMDAGIKNFTYVQISQEELSNIHLKNKGASNALSIAIPVLGIGAAIAIGTWATVKDGVL
ncbi:hypothetical protein LCM02_08205 [Lutimonas saemankumensis]|uniref:hypothetical protein n=1 Tax=Lutimonas saemankumensis TaxID=483016 RepID=UPI001CD494FA|nr:hypothetical protein [Lutimonas saemankumensis]MCA0932430.1 hypothetical protein [Lutimonas saemankumensis]